MTYFVVPRAPLRRATSRRISHEVLPMKENKESKLGALIRKHEADILAEWLKAQFARQSRRDQVHEAEIRATSKEFLNAIVEAMRDGSADIGTSSWAKVRDLLAEMSSTRASQGFSATETATFVLSLKEPIFARLRQDITDARTVADEMWVATLLL